MKRVVACILAAALLSGCKTSPTGRTQIMMFPEHKMNELGAASFDQIKTEQPVEANTRTNQYVRCIADALIAQLPNKYAQQNWEVVVFKDDSANAFALPGGKIGVHTGLLKVAKNQHQLAAVMGHEVGHVIAQHGNERMTQSSFLQAGLQVSNAVLEMNDVQYRNAIMQGLGVGAQVGVALPFGRAHESEADIIGLELMAKAGFKPQGSVELWQNMEKLGGDRPMEFLSTHPSPDNRIEKLNGKMAEANSLFRAAQQKGLKPQCKV
ncbi:MULTISPECIES: M48 family metallopeptidase [Pseudoalteromonas]|uniref:M48 family metallopeptidase n=1 Tax=Pseudoalteromonas obscura TaxID=3048491 RepID=A0ABT7ESG2_9GAMM|nr:MULTISPECIES: M48 family metallopeptidase [Pseudoalteromonas]MBQ4835356.1 M48 family metallopeptidase [Pseudoalteromonas luteoviolacea]MDK2598000.1 M48 family metallopeptidase [Pseudoalteromonas sp. P94(2023)]